MERVQNYFLSRVKKGVLLSHQNLLDFVKVRKIELSSKQKKKLPYLRRKWKYVAMFTRPRKKAPAYMSLAYPKIGVLFVDLAIFHPELSAENDKCGGKKSIAFLAALSLSDTPFLFPF